MNEEKILLDDARAEYQKAIDLGDRFEAFVRDGLWDLFDKEVLKKIESDAISELGRVRADDVAAIATIKAKLLVVASIIKRVESIGTAGRIARQNQQILELSSTP